MAVQQNIVGTTSGNNIKLDNVVLDVYSQEIMFKAQPVLRFESVAVVKTDLTVSPGGRIAFLLYNALAGPSAILETQTIETETMTTSLRYISVTEHARAIGVSELLLRQAITDVLADAAVILGMNYAKNRDQTVRDALYTSPNVLYAKAVTARNGFADTDVFDMDLIRRAVEQLAINKAPKFGGDAYICFVHPHQAKALRADSGWLSVVQYGDPSRVYNGEIGRIEDVRFIETTMIQKIIAGTTPFALSTDNVAEVDRSGAAVTTATGDAATNIYRAVICGENAVGIAQSLPVEMRDNGVEDFGRKHSIAYYGIWGAGRIEDGHAIVLETA